MKKLFNKIVLFGMCYVTSCQLFTDSACQCVYVRGIGDQEECLLLLGEKNSGKTEDLQLLILWV